MVRPREMLRLHREGSSTRRIARRLQVGRNTVRQFQTALRAAGLLEGSPDTLPKKLHLSGILDSFDLRRQQAADDRLSRGALLHRVFAVDPWQSRGFGQHMALRSFGPATKDRLGALPAMAASALRSAGSGVLGAASVAE